MTKRPLPTVGPGPQGLGTPTIMDPTLAARHGAPYVHLAVFAIDVDRVRRWLEEAGEEANVPFGWEVFLTEAYVLAELDLADELDRWMIHDTCRALIRTKPRGGEPPALGAQVPFSVYDAVARGAAPGTLRELFRGWGKRAAPLVDELRPLWDDPASHVAALSELCLDVPLDPPLAEPTARALDDLHDGAVGAGDET